MPPLPPLDSDIARIFARWPDPVQAVLMEIRQRLHRLADADQRIGPLQECLKWGQPSWVTATSKSGTTIRVGYNDDMPDRAWIYVHCGTSLISDYKDRFGDLLETEGNRAIALPLDKMPDDHILDACLAMALLYHVNKSAGKA